MAEDNSAAAARQRRRAVPSNNNRIVTKRPTFRAALHRDGSRFVHKRPETPPSSNISTSSSSSSSSDEDRAKAPSEFATLDANNLYGSGALAETADGTKLPKRGGKHHQEEYFHSLPRFRAFVQHMSAAHVGAICAGLFFLVLPYSLVSTVGQRMLNTNSSVIAGHERVPAYFTSLSFFHALLPLTTCGELLLILMSFIYFVVLWRISGEGRRLRRRADDGVDNNAPTAAGSHHHHHHSNLHCIDQIAPEHFHPRLNMLLGVAALLFHVSLLANQAQKLGPERCPEPVVYEFIVDVFRTLWMLATVFLPYWIIHCGFRYADLHLHLIGLSALLCLSLVRLADSLAGETTQEMLFWNELDHVRGEILETGRKFFVDDEDVSNDILDERRDSKLVRMIKAHHKEHKRPSACQYEAVYDTNNTTAEDEMNPQPFYHWRGTNQSLKPLFPFTAEFFLLQSLTCIIWTIQLLSKFIHGVFEPEALGADKVHSADDQHHDKNALADAHGKEHDQQRDEENEISNVGSLPHMQASQRPLPSLERQRAKVWLLVTHAEVDEQLEQSAAGVQQAAAFTLDRNGAHHPPMHNTDHRLRQSQNHGHLSHNNVFASIWRRLRRFAHHHGLWICFALFVASAAALFSVIFFQADGTVTMSLEHWELQRYLDFYCHCRTRRVIVFGIEAVFAAVGIGASLYIIITVRRIAEFYPMSAWQNRVTFGRKLHLFSDLVALGAAVFGELSLRALMLLLLFTEVTLDVQRRDMHEESRHEEFVHICKRYAPCGSYPNATFLTTNLKQTSLAAANNIWHGRLRDSTHDVASYLFGQFSVLDAVLAAVQAISVIMQTAAWMTVVLSVVVLEVPRQTRAAVKGSAGEAGRLRKSHARVQRIMNKKPAKWAMMLLAYLSLVNACVRVIVAYFLPYDTSIANSTAARVFGRTGWTLIRQSLFPFIMFFGTHLFVLMDEESHEFYARLCCKVISRPSSVRRPRPPSTAAIASRRQRFSETALASPNGRLQLTSDGMANKEAPQMNGAALAKKSEVFWPSEIGDVETRGEDDETRT